MEREVNDQRLKRRLSREAKKEAQRAKKREIENIPNVPEAMGHLKLVQIKDDSESEDEDKDSVQKVVKMQQSKKDSITFMAPKDLACEVVKNDSSSIKTIVKGNRHIQIAQGEGKIPSLMMRDEHFDVKAFPKYFLSGKFGLHHPRKYKLSPSKYFIL